MILKFQLKRVNRRQCNRRRQDRDESETSTGSNSEPLYDDSEPGRGIKKVQKGKQNSSNNEWEKAEPKAEFDSGDSGTLAPVCNSTSYIRF